MANWLHRTLLNTTIYVAFSSLCIPVLAQTQSTGSDEQQDPFAKIVAPDLDRRDIKQPNIDKENWELGFFYGGMSIEDFGSDQAYGARLAYHVTEDFFAELTYGESTLGVTSFEKLSGGLELLTDEQRELWYYSAAIGYNVLQGEVFIGSKRAFNSNLYITLGAGSTDFIGNSYSTYTAGVGTRMLLTDWLAIHGDVRAHRIKHDLFVEDQIIINIEPSLGFTVFF